MKTIISIAAIFIFSLSIFAQSQPTLDETYNFLKGKIDGGSVSYKLSSSQIDEEHTFTFKVDVALGTRLRITETFFNNLYHKPFESTSTRTCSTNVTLRLDQIVPDSIKVLPENGVFYVVMKPSDGNKIRKFATCSSTGRAFVNWKDGSSEVAVFALIFTDKEKAEKVAKALIHAVKLNGGKEELF